MCGRWCLLGQRGRALPVVEVPLERQVVAGEGKRKLVLLADCVRSVVSSRNTAEVFAISLDETDAGILKILHRVGKTSAQTAAALKIKVAEATAPCCCN